MRWILPALFFATTAQADLNVRFLEGAPVDRFVLTNVGACEIAGGTFRLLLEGSSAGLIFDVTEAGAGVEVFQPLTVTHGLARVIAVSDVTDGSTKLEIQLSGLSRAEEVIVTADLDDTRGNSLGQIRVAGAEIAGAEVSWQGMKAAFGADATATIPGPPCA